MLSARAQLIPQLSKILVDKISNKSRVSPYRSRLIGERAPSVKKRLADEEKRQQCQQDGHTGDRYRAHHCQQQLVTLPRRPPSHALGGRGETLKAFFLADGKRWKMDGRLRKILAISRMYILNPCHCVGGRVQRYLSKTSRFTKSRVALKYSTESLKAKQIYKA